MGTQKKSDFTKGLKIALLVLLAAWALFQMVYWVGISIKYDIWMTGIGKLALLAEIATGVMAFVALLTTRDEKNKGIVWGVFVAGLVFAFANIWFAADYILVCFGYSDTYTYIPNEGEVIIEKSVLIFFLIFYVISQIVAMTCQRWEKARVVLGICIGMAAFAGLYAYSDEMSEILFCSYAISELCFMIAIPLFFMWVAKKRFVSFVAEQGSVQERPMLERQVGVPTQYVSAPSGGFSSGTRNGMAALVKGGGTICLLGMIAGSFLPIFAVSGFNFAMVLWGLIAAAGDGFVQGVMGMLGYSNIELKAWLIVIGIVVLYLLEWKAFRKALDYPFHRGYGWNIWLLLSSAAGAIFFCTVKFWFDFIGMGRRDVAGIGLIVLQWSHIILLVLSIIAIIVKNDYNKEQRRKKMGTGERTDGTSFSTTVARTMTPVPVMTTSSMASVPTIPTRTMAVPIQNTDNRRFCTKCGQPLVGDAVFCGECGAKVEEKLVCKGCGKERIGTEKFCTKCGTKFEIAVNATESVGSGPMVLATGLEGEATLLQTMAEETATTLQQDVAEEEEDLFTQAFVALESGEFWKAEGLSKQILQNEPNNAQSYVIALMVQRQIRRKKELATGTRPLTEFEMYRHALSLAEDELKEELEGYNRTILDGNMDRAYSNACETMRLAEKAEKYELKIRRLDEAIAQFDKLEGWKDSEVQIELCESQKLAFTKQVYDGAKERMQKATEDSLSLKQQMALFWTAADEFKMIESSYDSEQLYEECMKQKAEREKALKAKKRKKIIVIVRIVAIVAVVAAGVAAGSVLIDKANKEKERQERIKQEQYDADYAKMQEQIAQGRYEDAIETMTSSVAYSKAEKMVQEAVYELANEYVDEKMYEKAEEAYSWLGDYEDCIERREMIPELEFLLYAEIKKDTSDGTYTLVKVDKDKAPSVVVVPDKVSKIGVEAFADCAKIEEIVLPDGVTYIGDGAFKGCENLSNVEIPESVTSIGNYLFEDCSSLSHIKLPKEVTSIVSVAFRNCMCLTNIELPAGVTNIGSYAFSGCSSLSSIEIPERVISIEAYVFSDCSSLSGIKLPAGVVRIGHNAFSGCSSLRSINIPAGVTNIGDYIFDDCSNLRSIKLPSGVTSIGKNTFSGCSSLSDIEIPLGVTRIGESAFSGCSSLSEMEIPEGVTIIGDSAFLGCTSLSNVEFSESVTWIGNNAFLGCNSLNDVRFPAGVTSIGKNTFSECSGLSDIHIPVGVTSIGESAFSGCSGLNDIHIPVGVTSIGESAFSGCSSLCNIEIPKSVTNIGSYAFSGCRNLSDIDVLTGVQRIGKGAFQNCTSLSSIKFSDGLKSISSYAFSGCGGLSSIELPVGLTSIGDNAFKGCSSLSSIELPVGLTSIGGNAFEGCSSLSSIELPVGLTSIGGNAFEGCGNLGSMEIPFGVTEIWGYTFRYCNTLREIVIPSSVTFIGHGAFQACSKDLLFQVEFDSYAYWYAKSNGFLYETY